MYRYPMSQMGGSIVNINHFENKDKVHAIYDGHSYNFYVVKLTYFFA